MGQAAEGGAVPQQGVTKLLKVTPQNCQAWYAFNRSNVQMSSFPVFSNNTAWTVNEL